ncbi:hypothetical protein CLF_107108 [Clonorchis sinensis]|uniref:Uncharacterized protein n=1 Tax=Clonorchis sinensis TaxID=79923 RepID=G7YQF9_CLOSI|nr:hypothetical protein CLF_107108 [Clonorchis sinensis]
MILRVTVGVVLLCNRIIPSGFLEEHCRTFVVFICRLSFISHMVSWTFSTLPSVLFARTDEHVSFSYNHLIYALSCSTLPMPSYHATRRKHEGWDTARLPKPRQGKSRGRDKQKPAATSAHYSSVVSLNPHPRLMYAHPYNPDVDASGVLVNKLLLRPFPYLISETRMQDPSAVTEFTAPCSPRLYRRGTSVTDVKICYLFVFAYKFVSLYLFSSVRSDGQTDWQEIEPEAPWMVGECVIRYTNSTHSTSCQDSCIRQIDFNWHKACTIWLKQSMTKFAEAQHFVHIRDTKIDVSNFIFVGNIDDVCFRVTIRRVHTKQGKHWTRVSLLLGLISSAYPVALPGFEPRTSDMRGERVTTTPPTHVGRL